MPRAKAPLKSDLLRQELADWLGLPVEDILAGDDAAEVLGMSRKRLAGLGGSGPMVYLNLGFGKFGIMFYTRTDLLIWRDDKPKWAAQNKAAVTHIRPWPTAPVPKPGAADTVEFLDRIINRADFKDDKAATAYKDAVLGRVPFPPPTPEEMRPEPARSKVIGGGWGSKRLRSGGA